MPDLADRFEKEPTLAVLNRALAWFEAFRKLGFPPGDIYCALQGHDHSPEVQMGLRQLGREFWVDCGRCEDPQPTVAKQWTERAEWWNAAVARKDPECDAIWDWWMCSQNRVGFVTALMAKGFIIGHPTALGEA